MLTPALVELRDVVKAYGALRPLRIRHLSVAAGETVVIEGPDEAASAVLVDLLTATVLPDAGQVLVGERATSNVKDQPAWLTFLDQFGIVSPRVVLLDGLTVLQNLAVPLTLDLDPLSDDVQRRAAQLAAHVGLDAHDLDAPLSEVTPLARLRVRLGRAIAHEPRILLVEHPTLGLDTTDASAAAGAFRGAARPGTAVLVVTADRAFAEGLSARCLVLHAPTGELRERTGGWLARGRGRQ